MDRFLAFVSTRLRMLHALGGDESLWSMIARLYLAPVPFSQGYINSRNCRLFFLATHPGVHIMKLTTSFITAALAFSSLASAIPQGEDVEARGIIPITSSALQALVSRHTLLAHARQFVKFSEQSGGTRAFGSRAHNSTVRYIKTLLDATLFYDTTLQTFPYLYSSGSAQITANGTALTSRWFTYGPSGDVSANLVVVNNLGCDAVSKS